jgi:BlaI family transcriptional regulator, penicillinase repressor
MPAKLRLSEPLDGFFFSARLMTDILSVVNRGERCIMKLDRITDGELSILQILWNRGEATSREITAAVHAEVTDPKMASVQKLVERLEAKGCVERDRSARAHRFRPLVSHEQFLRSRLQALADRLCEGAIVPLMTTLLRSDRLPKKEREQLRELVDNLWPSKDRGNRASV